MNAAEVKLDLINRIANLKESRIIEEIKSFLDFEQDTTVFQLNDEQKARLLKAQNDEILTEDEANNEIEKWLQEK